MAKRTRVNEIHPPGSSNNGQRMAVIRQMVCSFPGTKEGLLIKANEDASEQVIDFFVSVVSPVRGLGTVGTRQAVEWAVATLQVDGRLFIAKRGDSWRIRADFRNKQLAIADKIEQARASRRSAKPAPTRRRAFNGQPGKQAPIPGT